MADMGKAVKLGLCLAVLLLLALPVYPQEIPLLRFNFSGACEWPLKQAGNWGTAWFGLPQAEAAYRPVEDDARLVELRAHILAKYGQAAAREPIPMDCRMLQKKQRRSYMEEYALYRWHREHGDWEQALTYCEASRAASLAFDKRLGLEPESAAPYLTDKGELLLLLGRLTEAQDAFIAAADHLQHDPDRVLDSPYLEARDRARLVAARQAKLAELQHYAAQLQAVLAGPAPAAEAASGT